MSKTAARWTIFFVVVIGILVGTWVAVNHGFSGTVSGTYDKVATILSGTPPEDTTDLNVTPQPERPGTTEPTTPSQDQPGQPGQPEQPKTDMNPPVFGLPGFGIPNPLPGASEPSTTEPSQGSEQQPSGTLDDAGAALDQLKLQSPTEVLKACVAKLKSCDLVGAERYVSPNGLTYTLGATTGVHEILWKGLYQVQAYQTIGYDAMKVSGQTALVPLYASLGDKRMVAAYVVMAHRGDGWKLDHITDPTRF
jgi:hypothetical protein